VTRFPSAPEEEKAIMPIDFDPQIPFVEEHQKRSRLCWIAVALSVKRHFDPTSKMRQCELVEVMPGISGPCCSDPDGVLATCNQAGHLEDALRHVGHLASATPAIPNPKNDGVAMTFAEIQAQINKKLPVCVFIKWPGQPIGHFILISGYLESGGKQYLYVNDPLGRNGPLPYHSVVSNYNSEHGTWQCTYRLKV
jgi:hypothetical protein